LQIQKCGSPQKNSLVTKSKVDTTVHSECTGLAFCSAIFTHHFAVLYQVLNKQVPVPVSVHEAQVPVLNNCT